MARDISELGADVFDDTPKPPRKISPKKRNYIIGLSITAGLLAGVAVATVILCNTALTDYSNVRNITYYYTPKSMLAEGEEEQAVLYKLVSDYKYPSTFRIPSQVNGYKVVGVADSAFAGHKEIKKIVMPDTLEWIGDGAFASCENLESFRWSANLAKVGVNAFGNTKFYSSLTQDSTKIYELKNGLCLYVGDDYFEANTALISDELDESEINNIKTTYGAQTVKKFSEIGIKKFSSGIFQENDKIVYLDFPENVTEILPKTFEYCENLKGLDTSHSQLTVVDDYAFHGCEQLSYINIPQDLTRVGDFAFSETGIIDGIPDLSRAQEIGTNVFAKCKSLTTAHYSGTVLPNYAFSGCSSLSNFTWENPDDVTYLGTGAFEGTSFTEFTVPKAITSIGGAMFKGAKKLEKVHFYGNPNSLIEEGSDLPQPELDENGDPMTDSEGNPITYMNTFIDYDGSTKYGLLKGVRTIKATAFDGCTSLTTIDLYDDNGDHWKGNEGEFYFPISLSTTDARDGIDRGNNFNSSSVTKVLLYPNVVSIGPNAFEKVKNLVSVELLDKEHSLLNRILGSAFKSCSNLENIDLPTSLASLGSSAFNGCSKLASLEGFENTKIGSLETNVFRNCSSLTHLDLPETVGAIKGGAFYGTTSLDYVIVPSELVNIEEAAFEACRENEGEFMPVYFDMTYDQAKEQIANFKDIQYGDETIRTFFLLGDGEEKVEGRYYWNGNKAAPAEII